jgi:predicted metal-dependent enzyme (double-stranded beta helix superfamily)
MSRRLQPEFRSATPAPTANSQSHEVALASLIARIRAAWLEPASPMRDQQLSRALIDFCVDSPLPAALGHPDRDGYRRVELERDMRQGWRLLAMVWAPGQRSSLHSHGGRPAHEAIWRGALTVEHFESTPLADERVLLCLLARDALHAGDAQMSPRFHEDIHRCSNEGDEVCVSLHLLPLESPPQRDFELCSDGAFRVFDAAMEHHETLHA